MVPFWNVPKATTSVATNQNEATNNQQQPTSNSKETSEEDSETFVDLAFSKAILTNIVIYAIYLLAALFFVGIIPHTESQCVYPYVMAVSRYIALMNFAINPVIYYWSWPGFRKEIKRTCCCGTPSSSQVWLVEIYSLIVVTKKFFRQFIFWFSEVYALHVWIKVFWCFLFY